MPIYKRRFRAGYKWCVYVILPNGRRYRRVIGTKKQAEQVHKKIESEIVTGKWHIREIEDVPFSALVEEYLEYVNTNRAASTAKIRKYRIEAHLLPYFGDTPISQITPQMVDNYKTSRVKKKASPNTVNRDLANLSHMFTMAIRWRYIENNAVADVEKMKIPQRWPRFLSQEEIERLLETAGGSHLYALLVAAIHTGMRKVELLNLKWSDINLKRQTVTVQAKDGWHTKNYRSRTLQMTPMLRRVLMERRRMQRKMRFESEYIFTYQGNRIKWGTDIAFKTAVRKADLEGVTLHTLRHTFASQLVMAGVPLRDVQELMGHRSFETTLQYAHLSEDHVKKQVLRLPFADGWGFRVPCICHAGVFFSRFLEFLELDKAA
ncbi:tyrosine-type recombinase/integrase [Candidatus Poribacteria bacterium]